MMKIKVQFPNVIRWCSWRKRTRKDHGWKIAVNDGHNCTYLKRPFILYSPNADANWYNRHEHKWNKNQYPRMIPTFQVVTGKNFKHEQE